MKPKAVLLDTSYFIRLLDKNDPLHLNAKGYYKYFTEHDFTLCISTIAIAEYCVGGSLDDLPLKNLQIIPFNLEHAKSTGFLAKIVFQYKNQLHLPQRNIIPNDTKLFSQAHVEKQIIYYLSADVESVKIYDLLKKQTSLHFTFINLNSLYTEIFGVLDL
jgi:predicted nucleic acid-binding protein